MSDASSLKLSDLVMREMVNRDLSEVLAIERNAHVSPWSRLSFEESLTRSEQPSASGKEPSASNKEPSASGKEPSATTKSTKKPSKEASTAPYYCRVLEHGNRVLGYYIVSAVADELHILNVVVAKQVQSSGLGHVLMQDIERLAKAQGLNKIFLEVRASNEPAIGLYKKWQFEQIALRKNYYSTRPTSKAIASQDVELSAQAEREDALVFMRRL